MAASAMERPGGPSRRVSLQRMLDLEQKYKMARIGSEEISPMSSPVAEAFYPEHQSRQPLQSRRRNPPEQFIQRDGGLTLQTSRRPGLPLSITIPSPTSPDHEHTAETEMKTPRVDRQGEATPGKTVTFFEAGDDDDQEVDEDDEDDLKSEQSSICHSPSWENYGQKKKDKKAKAEKKRQDKAKADQELKTAKKRLANRLAKMPPASASATTTTSGSTTAAVSAPTSAVGSGKMPKGLPAPLMRFGSQPAVPTAQPNKLEKPVPQRTSSSWGIGAFTSGLVAHAADPYPPHVTKAIAAAKEHAISKAQMNYERQTPQQQLHQANSSKALRPVAQVETRPSTGHGPIVKPTMQKAHTISASEYEAREAALIGRNPRAMTMPQPMPNEISYPPPASRTHVLKQTTSSNHGRVNSTSAIATSKADEVSKFSKAQNMRSSHNPKMHDESRQDVTTAEDRGRQRSSSVSSYVRRARDQSTERSLAGLNDELAVSEAVGAQQQSKRTNSRRLTSFLKHKTGGEGKPGLLATDGHPSGAVDTNSAEKGGDHSDYFTFVNGQYNPPSLELNSGTLLSSLRSMMSRRSSASSGQAMPLPVTAQNSSHALSKPQPEHGSARPAQSSRVPLSTTSVGGVPDAVVLPPKAARVLGEYHATSQAPPVGSRPSEGSSMSSYKEDSSVPPSPASTPDTSRPQSTKGAGSSVDDGQIGHLDISLPRDETISLATARYPALARDGATLSNSRPSSKGRDVHSLQHLERPPSRGRVLDELVRPSSRGRLLQLDRRPLSKTRAYEDLRPATHSEETIAIADDDHFSRTAMPIDIDAQSFVTTLTNLDDADLILPEAADDKDARWGFLDGDSRPGSSHSQMDRGFSGLNGKHRERSRSSDSRRGDTLLDTILASPKQMPISQEEIRPTSQHANIARINNEYTDYSSSDSTRVDATYMPPIKQQIVIPPKSKARMMGAPLSAPLPTESKFEPHRSSTQSPASSSSSSSGNHSAAYLHEARRSTPHVPSLLSNIARPKPTATPMPAATGPRPVLKPTSTAPASVPRQQSLHKAVTISTPQPAYASAPDLSLEQAPAQHRVLNANTGRVADKPIAKMLVECCSCKFFLDMPSRVYECMASPDAVVTDRALGVSGCITTMVKCPWCAHNMSTRCCAGYVAAVYLKDRMH